MSKTTRTFSFDTEDHRHLLQRLDRLPNGEKSRAVREGLRLYFGDTRPEPSPAEILAVIREEFAALKRTGLALATSPPEMEEDPAGELKAALLNLGL